MEILTLTTAKFTGIAVPVPEEAFRFWIYEADWLQEEHSVHWFMPDNTMGRLFIDDIENEYEILGKATELTEEECEEIVEEIPMDTGFWISYINSDLWYCGAYGSLTSLLQSAGALEGVEYVILRRVEG